MIAVACLAQHLPFTAPLLDERLTYYYSIVCIFYHYEKGSTMSKYADLTAYLIKQDKSKPHTVHFSEIERVIGAALPESARLYQAWWANQSGKGHSQAVSWCCVGWNTKDVDLANQRVTFFYVEEKLSAKAKLVETLKSEAGGLTIEQAKRQLAATFGVQAEQIEITIRG